MIDNEEDLDNPEYEHRILLGDGETPLKADGITRRTYCDEDGFRDGRNNLPGYLSFRDVDELLDEMEQIIIFLQTDHPDFDISNLYFLPANEPTENGINQDGGDTENLSPIQTTRLLISILDCSISLTLMGHLPGMI
ncbi:MAG: hypothetical protein HC893_07640 [Chloroflexaceae bacterium]|nr:hypothetical protein [Chloroflexaceae bacterium]